MSQTFTGFHRKHNDEDHHSGSTSIGAVKNDHTVDMAASSALPPIGSRVPVKQAVPLTGRSGHVQLQNRKAPAPKPVMKNSHTKPVAKAPVMVAGRNNPVAASVSKQQQFSTSLYGARFRQPAVGSGYGNVYGAVGAPYAGSLRGHISNVLSSGQADPYSVMGVTTTHFMSDAAKKKHLQRKR